MNTRPYQINDPQSQNLPKEEVRNPYQPYNINGKHYLDYSYPGYEYPNYGHAYPTNVPLYPAAGGNYSPGYGYNYDPKYTRI